jgi:formylglycine-generating enzyme required for sulfatase activity
VTSPPQPFIASQRLFLLEESGHNRLEWLAQARFTARRRYQVEDADTDALEETGQDASDGLDAARRYQQQRQLSADDWQAGLKWELEQARWEELGKPVAGWDEIQDREQFWLEKNRRCICVVDNAGLGKTEVLDQAAYLRSVAWPGHLVVRFDFLDLIKHGKTPLLGIPHKKVDSIGIWPLLVRFFWGRGFLETTTAEERLDTWRLLSRAAKTGRMTLVVDSLDQVRGIETKIDIKTQVERAANRLANFLDSYQQVKCIMSGRPFSVQTHVNTLFKLGEWDFVQLDCFDEPQSKTYFGPLWEHVKKIESFAGLVPRDFEGLRGLTESELSGLRTQADIYTACQTKSLKKARERQHTNLRYGLEWTLLSLLAFEMRRVGNTAGVGDERGDSEVDQRHLRTFCDRVWKSHSSFLKHEGLKTLAQFQRALRRLNQLNSAMEPGTLGIPYTENALDRPLVWLSFRNRTLQDYYAARWLTNFTSERRETSWLHQHRPLRGAYGGLAEHGDFEELWRFVAEMPKTAADDKSWLRTVAPLFEELPAERTTAVCSELIFRAWPRLMRLAGPPPDQPSGNADVPSEETPWCERQTHGWQKHVAAAIKRGTFPTGRPPENASAKEWAGHLLRQFLGTFPRLAFGPTQGSERKGGVNQAFGGTRDAAEVAREIWEGFIKIPAGQHWMGQPKGPEDESDHIATSSGRTSLSRYPLTNEAYALFSPRHCERFSDYARYSPSARCPAIYLTWVDAWCVATWMHARLPNEYEWEAACRAQFWQPGEAPPQHQTYWFGDAEEKLKLHAWYFDNSGFKTHPIGAEGHANALGFSDMLGQVWEWTGSPYAMHPKESKGSASAMIVSRVLRGGAFIKNSVVCRSAFRSHWPPANANDLCGVRLARAEYL